MPAAPIISKLATKDHIIGDGIKIRAGDVVACNAYVLHRNPKYWEDPLKFDPLRWLAGEDGKIKRRHDFAYMAFSKGPRECLGKRFAIMESKTMLVKILQNFDFVRKSVLSGGLLCLLSLTHYCVGLLADFGSRSQSCGKFQTF